MTTLGRRWQLSATVWAGAVCMLLANIPARALSQVNFSPDLLTGASTHTIPIETPAGTNGMGPKLAFTYHSDGDNDWLGQGWSLSGLGYIERRGPNYTLAPGFDAADSYILHLGGAHKLVYTTDGWRTEIESFLKFSVAPLGGFIVHDKTGTKYYFGQSAASQQTLPGNPSYIIRWYLEKVEDTRGVFWTVSYDKDAVNGDMYPKQIVYSQGPGLACSASNLSACRVVDFVLTDRTNGVLVTYNNQGRIASDKLLYQVIVKMGNQQVSHYYLGYQLRDPTARTYATVPQLYYIFQPASPAHYFTYNVDANGSSLVLAQTSLTNSPPENLGGPFETTPTARSCTYTADINSDGLPDVVVGMGSGWYYYPNVGGQNFAPKTTIPSPGVALPSLCSNRTEYYRYVSKHKNYAQGVITYTVKQREQIVPVRDAAIIDLDGDGFPDVLHSPGVGQWYWWRSYGDSGIGQFNNRVQITTGPSTIQLNDTAIRLADMDADGLVDIVHFQYTPPTGGSADNDNIKSISRWTMRWWRNLGVNTAGVLSFAATPTTQTDIVLHHSYPDNSQLCDGVYSRCISRVEFTSAISYSGSSGISLVDMNGDGLPDIVWEAINNPPSGVLLENATSRIHYIPNFGRAGFGSRVTLTHPDGSGLSLPNNSIKVDANNVIRLPLLLAEHQIMVDVNNDGLPDILVGAAGNYYYYPQQIQTIFGGTYFGYAVPLSNSPSVALTRSNYMTISDIDGNGSIDFLQGNNGYRFHALDTSNSHQLLRVVTNPLGGRHTLAYQNLRDNGTIHWVLQNSTADDGLGQTATTNYSFSGGVYVSYPFNEFRGYARATVIDPWDTATSTAHRTITEHYQGDALKGRVKSVTAQHSTGATMSVTTFNYNAPTYPYPGVSRADLASKFIDTYEATPSSKTLRTYFSNYDDYGNPRLVTTSGTNIVTRVVSTEYAYNYSSHIVALPFHAWTTLNSATGTKIAESWFDYDGLANGQPPTQGNLTKETRWFSGGANPAVQYFYDGAGNRTGVIDAKGNLCSATGYTSLIEYDGTYKTFPLRETNALCQAVNKTYWGLNTTLSVASVAGAYALPGALATVQDVNGVRTDSYWDALSRPLARVVPPDTSGAPTISWSYILSGTAPSITVERARESVGGGTLDRYTYADGFGRAVQTKSEAEVAGNWVTQDTWYNSRGLPEYVLVPYLSGTNQYSARATSGWMTTTLYDAVRRPTRITNPDGTYRTKTYSPFVVADTDEKSYTTTRTYDALGRLIHVSEPAGGGNTGYAYDTFFANGTNQQWVVNNQSNYLVSVYDTLGRKTTQADPDLGTWVYTYDANGNLLTQKDAKLQQITFSYDRLNRVDRKTYPDSTYISFEYDEATAGTYRKGRLYRVFESYGASTVFTYDLRGRQTKVTKAVGFNAKTMQYSYDSLDRLATMTYPDNEVVTNSYNAQGLLEKVRSTTNNLDYIVNLDYNALGQLTGKSTGNGKSTTYNYYSHNQRLSSIVTPGLQSLNYDYDEVGNLSYIIDTVKSTGTQIFGYDNLHRLTSAVSNTAPNYSHSYAYSPIGNMSTGAGKTLTYPGPGISRPHAPTSDGFCNYEYDANGSMSKRTCGAAVRTFTWDFDNRLTEVRDNGTLVASYGYDYAGQRVVKSEGSVLTFSLFPQHRQIGSAVTKYYFAGGQRVAERDSANNVAYYHVDHLGSSNIVSNSSGAEVKETHFFPYGSQRKETGTKAIVHKYTGQELDASGLYYYGARYYDPNLMRFISADSVIPDFADPQAFNRYAYVRNNPMRYVDPDGRIWTGVAGAVAGAIVGYVNDGWKGAAVGAGVGFVAGMTFGAATPWLANIAANAVGGSSAAVVGTVYLGTTAAGAAAESAAFQIGYAGASATLLHGQNLSYENVMGHFSWMAVLTSSVGSVPGLALKHQIGGLTRSHTMNEVLASIAEGVSAGAWEGFGHVLGNTYSHQTDLPLGYTWQAPLTRYQPVQRIVNGSSDYRGPGSNNAGCPGAVNCNPFTTTGEPRWGGSGSSSTGSYFQPIGSYFQPIGSVTSRGDFSYLDRDGRSGCWNECYDP